MTCNWGVGLLVRTRVLFCINLKEEYSKVHSMTVAESLTVSSINSRPVPELSINLALTSVVSHCKYLKFAICWLAIVWHGGRYAN